MGEQECLGNSTLTSNRQVWCLCVNLIRPATLYPEPCLLPDHRPHFILMGVQVAGGRGWGQGLPPCPLGSWGSGSRPGFCPCASPPTRHSLTTWPFSAFARREASRNYGSPAGCGQDRCPYSQEQLFLPCVPTKWKAGCAASPSLVFVGESSRALSRWAP